jgi:predicted nucleotidyltransferase
MIAISNVLNVYGWGSRVYGTATAESDWDFIVITEEFVKVRKQHSGDEIGDDEAARERKGERRATEQNPILFEEPMLLDNVFQIDKTFFVYEDPLVNMIFIPRKFFTWMLLEHRHEALQCYFAPVQFV